MGSLDYKRHIYKMIYFVWSCQVDKWANTMFEMGSENVAYRMN